MNIITKPYDSQFFCCRPDTTWERENRDFYSPECVNEICWAPVLFARISKAGKCIGKKFAERYYDSLNFGVLLYCSIGNNELGFTSCIDHTSILPMPLFNPIVMESEDNVFEVKKGTDTIFTYNCGEEVKSKIEEAICDSSKLTSLRIGDFVAIELSDQSPLVTRNEGEIQLNGTFCENETFSFKILF